MMRGAKRECQGEKNRERNVCVTMRGSDALVRGGGERRMKDKIHSGGAGWEGRDGDDMITEL